MQLVSQSQQAKVLTQMLTVNSSAMLKMVPRTSGDPQRLLRIAFNAVAYDDNLSECLTTMPGKASILGGIMEALKLGITIGGPMQEGWLIPFKVQGTMKAQLMVGYQGYRNIIDRGRSVVDFIPRAVHVKDFEAGNFDYELGSRPFVRFKPQHEQPTKREQLHCVFGVANLRGGGQQIDVLLIPEIDAHRNRSRAKDNGPWVTDYVPMAMKTVVRKMSKYLPKSNELLSRALDLDNKLDSGQEQDFDLDGMVVSDEPIPPAATTRAMDALKDTLGAGKPKEPGTQVGTEPGESELTSDDIPFGGR